MTIKYCVRCGKENHSTRKDICSSCYNSEYYGRTKSSKNIKCPNCARLDFRLRKGVCNKCYMIKYYSKNKKNLIQKAVEWGRKNIEKKRENARKSARVSWSRKTTEQKLAIIKKQEKARSIDQREKRKQYAKEYYQRNKTTEHGKENARASKEARRARENNVPNLLSRKEWKQIKEAYDYRCAYCGNKPIILTQDHVIPIAKGGWHVAQNIVPACQPCNRKKGVNPPPPGFVMKKIIFD